MKGPKPRALLLTLLAALTGCGDDVQSRPDAAPEPDATPAFDHPATVLYVRDGDTLEVRFQDTRRVVRLAGIDTPELSPPPEPFAEEAMQFTLANAPVGELVGLEFDNDQCAVIPYPAECFDIYDRMLAYVRTREGYDLNAILVANGLARVYDAADFSRKTAYLQLEQEAQNQHLGIWSQ